MSKTAKPVSKKLPLCGWCDEVPLELHGHRKKLLFFLNSLDMFCHERELVRADISILEVGCSNGRNIRESLNKFSRTPVKYEMMAGK